MKSPDKPSGAETLLQIARLRFRLCLQPKSWATLFYLDQLVEGKTLLLLTTLVWLRGRNQTLQLWDRLLVNSSDFFQLCGDLGQHEVHRSFSLTCEPNWYSIKLLTAPFS